MSKRYKKDTSLGLTKKQMTVCHHAGVPFLALLPYISLGSLEVFLHGGYLEGSIAANPIPPHGQWKGVLHP